MFIFKFKIIETVWFARVTKVFLSAEQLVRKIRPKTQRGGELSHLKCSFRRTEIAVFEDTLYV
jgi:hypothetical protein